MTEERLVLAELLEKASDGDFLRAVAEAVLQLLMESDVEGMIGAGRYERSGERTTWRNGYRERTLDTRLGALQLRIPKLRQGSYFPPFLEARKSTEKALIAVIQEAWIGGVSTRRVDDLVQAMGLSGISKSQVSKLCKEIDERVHAFLDRPLAGEWPYLWLDATFLKQREGGRIVAVAAIIAMASNSEGRREIVGLHIGPSEAETQERLAQSSCHHAPASADSDRADGGSRRRRAEYLSLLRRAYGHRRDFRTRLPAATVAQSSNRLRQFMTSTLLPPSHIAAPVPGRYLIADGHPPPTATFGAAFGRQKAERSLQDHRSDPAHGDQTQRRGDYSPVVPVRNRKIRARTGAKSP